MEGRGQGLRSVVMAVFAAMLCFSAASARAEEPAYLSVGVGEYDIFHNNQAGDFFMEYRAQRVWVIHPKLGVEFTTDVAVFGYGGFHFDIPLAKKIVMVIGSAVGYYSDGNGKKLGNNVEFRSGGEFNYQFSNGPRLGVGLVHISNAGLGTHNPGTEILSLVYSIPLSRVHENAPH